MTINVSQTIPKNLYKRVEVDKDISAVGLKSRTHDFSDGLDKPSKIDNDCVELIIDAMHGSSSFKLDIRGREGLLKLKEALDFALEIKEEETK